MTANEGDNVTVDESTQKMRKALCTLYETYGRLGKAISDIEEALGYVSKGPALTIEVDPIDTMRRFDKNTQVSSNQIYKDAVANAATHRDLRNKWVGPNRCGHAASEKERELGYRGEIIHEPHSYGFHGNGWCDGYV